jgi:hypothetical protein
MANNFPEYTPKIKIEHYKCHKTLVEKLNQKKACPKSTYEMSGNFEPKRNLFKLKEPACYRSLKE